MKMHSVWWNVGDAPGGMFGNICRRFVHVWGQTADKGIVTEVIQWPE